MLGCCRPATRGRPLDHQFPHSEDHPAQLGTAPAAGPGVTRLAPGAWRFRTRLESILADLDDEYFDDNDSLG
jgi:hypothetical protein